ncbi:hypothetical protein EDD85DRAFT_795530 [Armillaria nabsnona]|nr:hypothetical protein EDD85DRAFT_795530 [Armillaria nabsnona]
MGTRYALSPMDYAHGERIYTKLNQPTRIKERRDTLPSFNLLTLTFFAPLLAVVLVSGYPIGLARDTSSRPKTGTTEELELSNVDGGGRLLFRTNDAGSVRDGIFRFYTSTSMFDFPSVRFPVLQFAISHQIRDPRRQNLKIYMEATPVLFALKLGTTMASEMQRHGHWDGGFASNDDFFTYKKDRLTRCVLLQPKPFSLGRARMDAWNDKADMSQAGKTLEAGLPCNVEKTVVYRTSAFYHTHAGAVVQASHSPKPTGGEDCRIACTDPKARFHTASHPCGRFFVRVGNVTKDVVPSDLNLSWFNIYVYDDGIWRQSFLRHQVDLQEVELDALPIPVAADLVEACAVYGELGLFTGSEPSIERTRAKHLREGGRARRDINGYGLLLAWIALGRGRSGAEGAVISQPFYGKELLGDVDGLELVIRVSGGTRSGLFVDRQLPRWTRFFVSYYHHPRRSRMDGATFSMTDIAIEKPTLKLHYNQCLHTQPQCTKRDYNKWRESKAFLV